MYLLTIAKALVPLIISGVIYLASLIGITPTMTVGDATTLAVTALVTALAVWLTPNKKV